MYRRTFAYGTLIAAIAAAVTALAPVSAHADTISCQSASVPTVVAGVTLQMHGDLCLPAGGQANTVQVMVPGATYDSTYWNFPYHPDVYNFRLAMNHAGYATFVVDRFGTGASSQPPSAVVTATTQALGVHNVVQALRDGGVLSHSFAKVTLVGHSLGSTIAVIEAATFHDVDGLVLTGFTHHISEPQLTSFFATLIQPAFLDPAFAQRNYDPGYLATRPGTRYQAFYAPGPADPAVLAVDEQTKSVLGTAEASDALGVAIISPYSILVDVPILIALGDHDTLFCGPLSGCPSADAVRQAEAPYFRPGADLQVYLLPGAGHDVNLVPTTGLYQQTVIAWANAH